MNAGDVLGAVESWAAGYVMLAEVGGVVEGRLDALLVPVSPVAEVMSARRMDAAGYFARAGLVGVEVKVTREDFLRGKRERQFEKYLESTRALAGLYLGVPEGMVKASEMPGGLGLLVVRERRAGVRRAWGEDGLALGPRWSCCCRRHPTWRESEFSKEHLFRVLFKMREEEQKRERDRAEAEYLKIRRLRERVGGLVGRTLDKLEAEACREAESRARQREETRWTCTTSAGR